MIVDKVAKKVETKVDEIIGRTMRFRSEIEEEGVSERRSTGSRWTLLTNL